MNRTADLAPSSLGTDIRSASSQSWPQTVTTKHARFVIPLQHHLNSTRQHDPRDQPRRMVALLLTCGGLVDWCAAVRGSAGRGLAVAVVPLRVGGEPQAPFPNMLLILMIYVVLCERDGFCQDGVCCRGGRGAAIELHGVYQCVHSPRRAKRAGKQMRHSSRQKSRGKNDTPTTKIVTKEVRNTGCQLHQQGPTSGAVPDVFPLPLPSPPRQANQQWGSSLRGGQCILVHFLLY